ncbi:hypothetical protein [Dietzia maris]|uniref:hypothetical protein n=1 Tax=Dietzia maris TaxID=37915 RepID=UPI003001E514
MAQNMKVLSVSVKTEVGGNGAIPQCGSGGNCGNSGSSSNGGGGGGCHFTEPN